MGVHCSIAPASFAAERRTWYTSGAFPSLRAHASKVMPWWSWGAGSLSAEDVQRIQAFAPYAEKDIQRMHKRFVRLDQSGSGTVTKQEFLAIPELAANPLAERIMTMIDEDLNDSINFEEFVRVLVMFSDPEERKNLLFRAFDSDNDGYITQDELFAILKATDGSTPDDQLEKIVEKTISHFDKDKDGKLSFLEFKQMAL